MIPATTHDNMISETFVLNGIELQLAGISDLERKIATFTVAATNPDARITDEMMVHLTEMLTHQRPGYHVVVSKAPPPELYQ